MTRAALAGAAWSNLVQEAIETVLAESGADRAAIWTESIEEPAEQTPTFRGTVAEKTGDAVPADWKRFLPEESLLRQLFAGATVEQEFHINPARVTIGASLGMRKGVWVPICTQKNLRAIVFAASTNKNAVLDSTVVEAVAAELALALELAQERDTARECQHDLSTTRSMLAHFNATESPEQFLHRLAQSCTNGGLRAEAEFALIGELLDAFPYQTASSNELVERSIAPEFRVEFSWRSGDEALTRAAEAGPNSAIWRQALEQHCVTGGRPAATLNGIERIVAVPLHVAGHTLGVLVAGLRQGNASLATLERLELRAAVAAQALWQRKQNRNAQRERAWNETLATVAQQPVVLLDAGARVATMTETARELLRLPGVSAPPNPQPVADLFSATERTRIANWLEQKQAEAASTTASSREPLETVLSSGTPARLRSLDPRNGYTAILLEPLQQSQTKSLTRAETEFFHVIEWLEEGIILYDAHNEIRAMNSRFAQMASLTSEQSISTRTLAALITQIASQTANPEKFAAEWRVLANGSASGVREEVQLLRPVPRVLERVSRPVLDGSGARLGRLELYRDLTAQRVFHSKLMRTEKLAALGQMVTAVAHEISNPLTSILGYAQRLLARNGATEQSGETRQIVQEAERASTILKQLLLTARDARPERRTISLNDLVKRTVELQKFRLSAENIHIEMDLDPALPRIHGDPGQLQQVLMNLISNARQSFQQHGAGGRLRFRTQRNGDIGAIVEVADNGPGIPEPILARIFDPFFTTKPVGVGTGLGLSIVLGIVRDHGGQVRVISPPGGGATFSIELPAAPANLRITETRLGAAPDDPAQYHESSDSSLAPWAGSLVLVVEDEATVGELIGDLLEDNGLSVDILLDGREALSRLASENYDLVICDMKMPNLDGEQFFKMLSRANPSAAQRVLFVTGDVLAARTRDFLERRGLPYLAKPFRVEELTGKVREVLMQSSPREPHSAKTKVARH